MTVISHNTDEDNCRGCILKVSKKMANLPAAAPISSRMGRVIEARIIAVVQVSVHIHRPSPSDCCYGL